MHFLSNESDCNVILNKQEDIANGIVKGVFEHFGIKEELKTNKYSYDDTVEKMIVKGITTIENMQYWERCLDGREELDKDNVRALFNRMLDKI